MTYKTNIHWEKTEDPKIVLVIGKINGTKVFSEEVSIKRFFHDWFQPGETCEGNLMGLYDLELKKAVEFLK
jgi:hypothetical protein